MRSWRNAWHTISPASPQTVEGTQYVFQKWSDGSGGASRVITVGSTAFAFTAEFAPAASVTSAPGR